MIMLLVEFTFDSTLYRISDGYHRLTNPWKEYIESIDQLTVNTATPHGGYCRPDFGGLAISPNLFTDNSVWPPDFDCPINVYYAEDTEANKQLLASGTAFRTALGFDSIFYEMSGPDFDETVAASTAYNDTLANVLDTILTGISEISTLDTTYARSPSPAVLHTTSNEQLSIDLASDMAAFFTHMFYRDGSTMYLIDMLGDAGSETVTQFGYFDFTGPGITNGKPVKQVLTDDNQSAFSAYPGGREFKVSTEYHTTQSNVEDALDDILTILNRTASTIPYPMTGTLPTPGKKITYTDNKLAQDVTGWFRCRSLTYDFENDTIELTGEGDITA